MTRKLRTFGIWRRVKGAAAIMPYITDKLQEFDDLATGETGCPNCRRVSISHTVTPQPFGWFLVTVIVQLELW